jgi:hypothetical protein
MATFEDWPEQSKMRRRSHAVVRWTLITISIVIAASTLLEHAGWPVWLRYGTYGAFVFVVTRFFPRPDWPDEVEETES